MTDHVLKPIIFATASVLAACASNGAHYEPIIDAPRNPAYYADLGDCQHLAERRDLVDGETVNRAALGAGLGAAVGAITGRRGYHRDDRFDRALEGAAIGAVVGGGTGLYEANRDRRHIVMDCMAGRGYRVLG